MNLISTTRQLIAYPFQHTVPWNTHSPSKYPEQCVYLLPTTKHYFILHRRSCIQTTSPPTPHLYIPHCLRCARCRDSAFFVQILDKRLRLNLVSHKPTKASQAGITSSPPHNLSRHVYNFNISLFKANPEPLSKWSHKEINGTRMTLSPTLDSPFVIRAAAHCRRPNPDPVEAATSRAIALWPFTFVPTLRPLFLTPYHYTSYQPLSTSTDLKPHHQKPA